MSPEGRFSSLEDSKAGDCQLIRGSFLNTNCSGDRWDIRTQDQGCRLGDVGQDMFLAFLGSRGSVSVAVSLIAVDLRGPG